MSALKPTEFTARIVWLGVVSRDEDESLIRSAARDQVFAGFAGVAGEAHAGRTRPACVRVKTMHPEGTEIANVRQFSILSAEEMAGIAAEIGLERLAPEWLGATMVVEGIPDFTHLPPSARLQTAAGTTLVIDMHNRPCHFPGKEIEKDRPGHGKPFMRAAEGRRGVTAWVEREGPLAVGDSLRLHVPDQRAWAHIEAARNG